jgi:oligosaccharide repeat unit polymerase
MYILLIANVTYCLFSYALRRDILNPLFVFSFVWSFISLWICVSVNDFYPIKTNTELVLLVGSTGFFIGNIFSEILFGKPWAYYNTKFHSNPKIKTSYVAIILTILLLGWFEYYRQMSDLSSGDSFLLGIAETRYVLVQAALDRQKLIGPIANLEVISIYFSMFIFLERRKLKFGNILTFISLAVTLFYVILGGSKGGVLTLLLTVIILHSFNKPLGLVIRLGLFAFGASIIVFCIGLIVTNYAYTDFSDINDMLSSLYISVRNYSIGSALAFDQVVKNPVIFGDSQSITRFFIETANSLGASLKLLPIHLDYVDISNTEDTNTYTVYYSYYIDGGILAVFSLSTFASIIYGFFYFKSKSSSNIYKLIYTLLLMSIIFSIVSEKLFLGLNGLIKAIIFWQFLYYISSKNYAPK